MGWTAGADVSTGDLITAATWNNYLGATGSLEYLKAVADLAILEDGSNAFTADQPMGGFSLTGLAAGAASGESARYDELVAVSQADVTGTRAINGTVYRNTTGKQMIVMISAIMTVEKNDGDVNGSSTVTIHCDGATPPTTQVSRMLMSAILIGLTVGVNSLSDVRTATFVVPDTYYYKATASNVSDGVLPVLDDWFEWTLH